MNQFFKNQSLIHKYGDPPTPDTRNYENLDEFPRIKECSVCGEDLVSEEDENQTCCYCREEGL